MLNVITKYKKESHDGMKRAACNERKKGWHLSAQCAFCHHDTPQTGQMEFRWPTLQDPLGGWRKLLMKCLNIFINNRNKNIPHFQSCFSLVLNTVSNSPLGDYYFRLSSKVRSPLYHIYDQMTSFVLAVSYMKQKEGSQHDHWSPWPRSSRDTVLWYPPSGSVTF